MDENIQYSPAPMVNITSLPTKLDIKSSGDTISNSAVSGIIIRKKFIAQPVKEEAAAEKIRLHGRTGRPLGSEQFVNTMEALLQRMPSPRKPGPKPRNQDN